MSNEKSLKEDLNEKKTSFWKKAKEFIVESCWWRIEDWLKHWIWPAYSIRNFFWGRYDLVKMPQIKRTEYSDVVERLMWANVELLKFFIEEEKPEEFIEWYGKDGQKYSKLPNSRMYLPEYEGQYVMDMMKEAYKYFTEEKPQLEKEDDYLLDVWYHFLAGRHYTVPMEGNPEYELWKTDESTIPTELSFFNDKDLDWDILDKYLDGDRNNIIKKDFLTDKYRELETKIYELDQKYLHMIVELRSWMWT